MTTVIYPEQKAHVISSDAEAIAIAKKLPAEFFKRDSERHQQRRLPYEEVKKFSANGLWGNTLRLSISFFSLCPLRLSGTLREAALRLR
ncbi:MAG: hypothetical protein V7K20_06850 [Nostoc sp.]